LSPPDTRPRGRAPRVGERGDRTAPGRRRSRTPRRGRGGRAPASPARPAATQQTDPGAASGCDRSRPARPRRPSASPQMGSRRCRSRRPRCSSKPWPWVANDHGHPAVALSRRSTTSCTPAGLNAFAQRLTGRIKQRRPAGRGSGQRPEIRPRRGPPAARRPPFPRPARRGRRPVAGTVVIADELVEGRADLDGRPRACPPPAAGPARSPPGRGLPGDSSALQHRACMPRRMVARSAPAGAQARQSWPAGGYEAENRER